MELVFVYNADSGLFNTLTDIAHKALSPDTYACHLCQLTYGVFTQDKDWKAFLKTLPHPMTFLHRDEFTQRFPGTDVDLPAVFSLSGAAPQVLLTKTEIEACGDVGALIALLQSKLGSA